MTDSPEGSISISLVLGAAVAALSGSLFAAVESALGSLSESRLQALAQEGRGGDVFKRYLRARHKLHARWLVGRATGACLATALIADAVHASSFARFASVGAVIFGVVVYASAAEVLMRMVRRRADTASVTLLRLLRPFEWLVAPIADPIALLGRAAARQVGPALHDETAQARLTDHEMRWVLSEGQKKGTIAQEPAEIIRNALGFKNVTARDVMVPRARVTAIEVTTPLDRVVDLVAGEGHSRYPVYRDSIDNVVGLLYAKDLYPLVRDGRLTRVRLSELLRTPVLFVAETQPAASLLREMRAKRVHLAIVLDGHGGTDGIVTLEDVLEEIVGEIRDEYDVEEIAPVQRIADGRFVADAAAPIQDVATRIGRELPNEGGFESLGGLIVHRTGRVPEVGATIDVNGTMLIVREADDRRVLKVEIVPSRQEKVP